MSTQPTLPKALATALLLYVAIVASTIAAAATTDTRWPAPLLGMVLLLVGPRLIVRDARAFTAMSALPAAFLIGASYAAGLHAASTLARPIDLGGDGLWSPLSTLLLGVPVALFGALAARRLRFEGWVVFSGTGAAGISAAFLLIAALLADRKAISPFHSTFERLGEIASASYRKGHDGASTPTRGPSIAIFLTGDETVMWCNARLTSPDGARTREVLFDKPRPDPQASSPDAFICPGLRLDRDRARGLLFLRSGIETGSIPRIVALIDDTYAEARTGHSSRVARVPFGDFLAAAVALGFAALGLWRARVASGEMHRLLSLPRGQHEGEGWIQLDTMGRVHSAKAAALPVGAVLVTIDDSKREGFREAGASLEDRVLNVQPVDDVKDAAFDARTGLSAQAMVALLAAALPLLGRFIPR
jgi:hypothetical protein